MKLIEKLENELQNLFNQSDYDNALHLLKEILEEESNSSELKNKAAHHLGRIVFYSDQLENAEEFFKNALNYYNDDVYSRVFLGLVFEKQNKFAEALRIFSSCSETNPDLDQLYYKIQKLSLKLSSRDDYIDKIISKVEESTKLKTKSKPLISIIILCYNKLDYTKKCLKSIFANTTYSNFEVVVVDNASVDDTSGYLEAFGDKIKFIRSKTNLGFVGGNNLAIESAEGEFVVFLNNDTEVKPKWLIGLQSIFNFYPNAGVVGSMLLFPDETLQEAGGIIFSDGSGWNYGRNDKSISSKYNFVREVDYCSGASLMVRKNILTTLGGFDNQYSPAYYEDTDLCFSARKLGYKVYYSPFSKVIHHEGITSGTDTSSGFKKYQLINKPKFERKWEDELKQQENKTSAEIFLSSNRKKGKRILIIDDIPPFPDRASGALRHYHILKQMIDLGYSVTYVHLMGKSFNDKHSQNYFAEFEMQGVEFFWFQYENWWSFRDSPESKSIKEDLLKALEFESRKFDLIYIAFWFIAEYFIDIIRNTLPNTPVLVDTVDIHFLREKRKAEISKLKKDFLQAEDTKIRELEVYQKADMIVTVTEQDRMEIKNHLSDKPIFLLPNVHDIIQVKVPFAERNDLLFVGSFSHDPNIDAVLYFVREVFPLIKRKLPNIKFYVVGNNPPEKIKNLNSKDIIVTGWVPEVKPYLEKCRISIVPLRYGAGMKGKVGETLSYGVPMVSTTIGAEGMGIENNVHSFITDDPKEFAEYTIKLYEDVDIWNRFSQNGKKLIDSNFSCENIKKKIKYIMRYNTRESLKTNFALNNSSYPKHSIILVTFNQVKYTLECIKSINVTLTNDYEIIVVDNKSTDDTVKLIRKEFPEVTLIENKQNLGFPKAVNQGILEAQGDYVLPLNNDIVVTEGWLDRMVEIAEKHPEVAIVGPISNSVSGRQLDKNAKYESIPEMHKYATKIRKENKGQLFEFPRVAFLCTLIKKEVIDKIGGLDERYSPGNFEDDDFCLRAQMAGYKTVMATDVFIHHYGSVSFKADGESQYAKRIATNKQKFVDKWGADPEEIWIRNVKPKEKELHFSINKDLFTQHIERSFINVDENEHKLAIENFKIAIENFNNSERKGYENIKLDELIVILGNIYFATNNLEKAKETFEAALNENPNSSQACQGLGDIFSEVEEYDAAKMMFEWAVKNDENNDIALEKLIATNQKLGLEPNNFSLTEE